MPHTSSWWGLMLELYRSHKTSFDIFLLVVLGVIVRVFYWGGRFRECCGDILIGTTIMVFAAAHLPNVTVTIPQVGVMTFSHNEIAFVVGMLGYKGLKAIIFFVLKNRFGIDLRERIAQRKNSN
ncbi:hypothetical protein [Salmonella enterica]|uniref:hypothetical protein n=1 Tax=Salmonella enterica TaxID=28901 RepID=UPI0012F16997|nr:hypothetical protein [Salmonella enterica]EBS2245239.1 hypothetical protein [Salmonella enterica subsp. enterica serovar Rissen]EBC7954408.1 hypothetical protein [Salmonella enterica]EDQ3870805.1 hypothetical protein [Salmonella enterica subsp. enterica serovar Rissen]EDR3045883.1 hypothetical protein [Salmonella enterica subsp. enterica serovar Rissen]EEQ0025408.1 hypothetical protein [Salmonella enterica]